MHRIARFSVLAAPLCLFAYGVIRLLGRRDGRYGPGLDWQAAHWVNLVGLGFFVVLVVGLRPLLRSGWVREMVVVLTLVGAGAAIVQFGADIVEGFMAADKAEMSRLSSEFRDIPGVDLAFYTVGPQLFFLGLIALTVFAARDGLLPRWSPVLALLSCLLPAVTLDLIPVGALCLLVAIAPLRNSTPRDARGEVAVARGD